MAIEITPEMKAAGIETEEQLQGLLNTFVKQRVTSGIRDKANAAAVKELKRLHKAEFDRLVAANMPKGA